LLPPRGRCRLTVKPLVVQASADTANLTITNVQRRTTVVVFIVVVSINALLLWGFHDRYWYPVDEGVYAHLAERLLAGEVLHVDIVDFHPGYGDFLNAAAFRMFGTDLVSLRYPLIAGALLQSLFVFALLQRRSLLLAACAAVASIALGVIHFLNPTPHWYALFGTCCLVYWMNAAPRVDWIRLVGTGFIVGAITLFHQLLGVLVGTGVLVVALQGQSGEAHGRHRLAGQLLLVFVLIGLVVYLMRSPAMEFSGVLLFACWPLAILLRSVGRMRTANADACRVVLLLASGALLSSVPLLVYCAAHSSWRDTLTDSVFAALSLGVRSTEAQSWYGLLALAGLFQALTPSTPIEFVNGVFWAVLPLLAAINGVLILTAAQDRHTEMNALPILSAFYAVSSLYMQNAIYLFFSAGMSLAAILWWLSTQPRMARLLGACAATILSAIAVLFHAGQPATRGNLELLRGVNVLSGRTTAPLDRASFRLDAVEQSSYPALVNVIETNVAPGTPIFAVPNDATLYFLSRRPNPFRFYNTGLSIQDTNELNAVLDRLRTEPPRLVTFRPADQYNTWASRALMEYIRTHYDRIDSVGGVDVYLLKAR
jgi:hypothetical protein